MEIADSARRHQSDDRFEDSDVKHAVAHALYVAQDGDDPDPDLVLYLGPDHAGRVLEVVVAEREDGSEVAIHAMKMRAKYRQLIAGSEATDD